MEAREAAKRTLGNLTLLTSSLNPSLGNDGWSAKRVRIGGSLLALSRDVAEVEVWDEQAIGARGSRLAIVVSTLWPVPTATEETSAVAA